MAVQHIPLPSGADDAGSAYVTDAVADSGEPHPGSLTSRANWLRAAVLGASDGIVSVSGIVVGVAGATVERTPIAMAGGAGLIAGALSMALGEYVSVSSQRDIELVAVRTERQELCDKPEQELAELAAIYRGKGLSATTAAVVAQELTAHDALGAHLEAELGIQPTQLTTPWHAAAASAVSFVAGALLPLLAILLPTVAWRVPVTMCAVLTALTLTASFSARLSGARIGPVLARVMLGGVLGLCITYGLGHLFGAAIA